MFRVAQDWGDGADRLRLVVPELAFDTGTQIEYGKLMIVTTLAIALVEITWALSNAWETFGGSLSWVPVVEGMTVAFLPLATAVVIEAHHGWQVTRRYLSDVSMEELRAVIAKKHATEALAKHHQIAQHST